MKDKIAKWFVYILEKYGIDPMYFFTIVCIILSLVYIKDFKNWHKTQLSNKFLAITTVLATSLLIVISLMRIVGILKFK